MFKSSSWLSSVKTQGSNVAKFIWHIFAEFGSTTNAHLQIRKYLKIMLNLLAEQKQKATTAEAAIKYQLLLKF